METKTETGGVLLKVWRDEQGLTSAALGNLLGVTQARVSQLENGDSPSLQLALLIEVVSERFVPVQSWRRLAEEAVNVA